MLGTLGENMNYEIFWKFREQRSLNDNSKNKILEELHIGEISLEMP